MNIQFGISSSALFGDYLVFRNIWYFRELDSGKSQAPKTWIGVATLEMEPITFHSEGGPTLDAHVQRFDWYLIDQLLWVPSLVSQDLLFRLFIFLTCFVSTIKPDREMHFSNWKCHLIEPLPGNKGVVLDKNSRKLWSHERWCMMI